MFFFKKCPRCHGDLFEDSDRYGKFISCLQCGYLKDVSQHKPEILKGEKEERISHGGRPRGIMNGSRPTKYSY